MGGFPQDGRDDQPDALMETLEWPAIPQLVTRLLADAERLRAVRDTELLDAADDEALDRLAHLAASALDAPKSAVTLLDRDRQVFAGRAGMHERESAMERSYCKYAAATGRPMAIRDAAADPVLRDNPATRDGVRCYLGVPLVSREGHALGTVCVFGDQPREWTARDVALLTEVGRAVMSELALRQALRRLS